MIVASSSAPIASWANARDDPRRMMVSPSPVESSDAIVSKRSSLGLDDGGAESNFAAATIATSSAVTRRDSRCILTRSGYATSLDESGIDSSTNGSISGDGAAGSSERPSATSAIIPSRSPSIPSSASSAGSSNAVITCGGNFLGRRGCKQIRQHGSRVPIAIPIRPRAIFPFAAPVDSRQYDHRTRAQ